MTKRETWAVLAAVEKQIRNARSVEEELKAIREAQQCLEHLARLAAR